MQHFLEYCMPLRLKQFYFNSWYKDIYPIGFYLQALKKLISKVTEKIILWSFEITNDELISLLSSCPNIKNTIGLVNSRILTHEVPQFPPSLSLQCSILNFNRWEFENWSDWKNHPEYLENLIKGLSKIESLKDTWKCIDNTMSRDEREWLKKVLESNNLSEIKTSRF